VTVVALWSAKGSPGVTTTVAALAAGWPEERHLLVVEADTSGGDFALWFDRPADPSIVSLAAAGRRALDAELVSTYAQDLRREQEAGADEPPRADRKVLLGPVAAEQAHAALSVLRDRLLDAVRSDDRDVLIDCGRLDASSGALPLVSSADISLAVCRPRVTDVHHLATRATALGQREVAHLLLVGDRPYGVAEVAEATGLRPFASVPFEERAASALAGEHPSGDRLLRRSSLMRSARHAAEAIVAGGVVA
jgi:MinD-like ATPase involved in chromosome partitioning or flagellar assembly